MRVLITGVSDATARDLARTLLAAGHQVVGQTDEPHRFIDPDVELLVATTGDATVAAAVAAADAVVHLGNEGAADLAPAAADGGTRVVLVGADDDAATPLRDAGVPLLVVRTAPLAGRRVDSATLGTLAGLLAGGTAGQVLHHDDLVRHLATVATSDQVGELELAAPGSVDGTAVRQALSGFGVPEQFDGVEPTAPVTGLTPGTGLAFGWSAAEALADAARGLRGRTVAGGVATLDLAQWGLPTEHIPHNLPAVDNGTLVVAGPADYQGEFDSLLDPRLSVLTATNTSEALPRPMTPMTISVQMTALRFTNRVMGELLAMEGAALDEHVSQMTCVLGHAVYLNASVGVNVVENMPGWDEQSVRRDVYGNIPADVVFRPEGGPPMPQGAAAEAAEQRVLAELGAKGMNFADEAERVHTAARTEVLDADGLTALDDAHLEAIVRLWQDRLAEAWSVSSVGVMLAGAAAAMHYAVEGAEHVAIDVTQLDSARTMLAVEDLADVLRGHDDLIVLAKEGAVAELCAASPEFARRLDAQLAVMGHRGPGECELVNPSFSDRPSLLLAAAAGAAQRPAEERAVPTPPTTPSGHAVVGSTLARERSRDAVVRFTHALRLALREQGKRLVARGVVAEPEDVFFLTVEETFACPADAAERVARRREERVRLATIRMPDVVVGTWAPAPDEEILEVGGELTGLGIFPGVVEGRVKVLRGPDDDIEPDDILVASVTDVGHTAMFSYAAAVVTDIGGVASHAAIVAREFGVPCVVDAKVASSRLEDGQWVRVDGAAGTVTLLADASEDRGAAEAVAAS
ncbi:PEP-utilizing enzyme [Nocardioides sambongensis]|uniref:PEP-utilizing enzyme n=1 Tax=Nocardioides sambongensis TaxID=2589074 RepID=UPI00112D02BF|nr:PEP-utilizing enzyme [Nocardioides sambongensis]